MSHPPASHAPSPFVRYSLQRISSTAATGGVLDLACGGGRHGRLFLDQGHAVTFVDRDLSGVADLAGHPRTTLIETDLEDGSPWPLDGQPFGVVMVVNYLWRPLLSSVCRAVAPGSWLVYETFAQGNEAFGRPRNPDFLLRPGELLHVAGQHGLSVRLYEHGPQNTPAPAVKQRLLAVAPQSRH